MNGFFWFILAILLLVVLKDYKPTSDIKMIEAYEHIYLINEDSVFTHDPKCPKCIEDQK